MKHSALEKMSFIKGLNLLDLLSIITYLRLNKESRYPKDHKIPPSGNDYALLSFPTFDTCAGKGYV